MKSPNSHVINLAFIMSSLVLISIYADSQFRRALIRIIIIYTRHCSVFQMAKSPLKN